MRSLPGDLFSCMSFIVLSILLLNLALFGRYFCQNNWSLSLAGISSNPILLHLKSRYTPFGLLMNLRLIDFFSWFLFRVFDFIQVTFNSYLNRVSLKSRVLYLVLPSFFLKLSFNVFLCLVDLSVFLQFITVVNCPIAFFRLLIFFYVCYPFWEIICFWALISVSFRSPLRLLQVTAAVCNNTLILKKLLIHLIYFLI